MDNKSMESYFDVIAEQIVDENKIVTYKSLSRSLGIHVNTAKQLLYAYLKKEEYKNSFPISATYLVAGKAADGSFNITVVNDAHLKYSYAALTEITSEHVYSVQKGKNLKEVKVLSGIGQELSVLKSPGLVIKCSKDIIKIKAEERKKHETHMELNRKVIREALMPEGQKIIPVEIKTKTENTDHKLKTESPKKSSTKKDSVKGSTNIKKPFGNIANLFAKASQKNPDDLVINKKDENNFKNIPKEVDIAILNNGKEIDWSESECSNIEEKKESKDNLKRKKKGSKRKRIQFLSDSEENDSNDGIEENSFVLNTNLEEKVKEEKEEENEKVRESILRSKKKKRKMIDRTVMNEDGYLETKKEIVFETDSENEPEEIATSSKVQTELNVAKHRGAQGRRAAKKQSSLLTFFRKT